MSVQGMFDHVPRGTRQITLGATAEPWPPKLGADKVRYRVGAGTLMVAMVGDLRD